MSATPAPTPVLELRDVAVGYEGRAILRGVNLAVAASEAVALLGPSGSGKTSLLYAVAGFVEPMDGEIRIRGRSVAGGGRMLPPERRSVGVVFQHYALWPHLSAIETVVYPMRRRGIPSREAFAEARALLDRMGIGHLADRRPAALSGGEQQRVGLARALARAPDVYLLDEPTAHLDTALKGALQTELAGNRRQPGAAMLYATHDVGEAMAVADRVALVRRGGIAQIGTPLEVYQRPVDRWAAELTGPASVLRAHVVEADGAVACLRIGASEVRVACESREAGADAVLVRPDWARVGSGDLTAVAAGVIYRGTHTDYRLDTGFGVLIVRAPGPPRHAVDDRVAWALDRAWPVAGEDPESPVSA